MDRQARRDTEEAIDVLQQGMTGTIYRDEIGPAVYTLEPTMVTAVACLSCRHLALIPSIPKKPHLIWECSGCGHKWALQPPAIVWVEGSRPELGRLQ